MPRGLNTITAGHRLTTRWPVAHVLKSHLSYTNIERDVHVLWSTPTVLFELFTEAKEKKALDSKFPNGCSMIHWTFSIHFSWTIEPAAKGEAQPCLL